MFRVRASLAALVAGGVLATLALPASAHEFRPGLLDVTSLGDDRFEIDWTPAPGGDLVTPVFPERCVDVGRKRVLDDRHFVLDCGAGGLAGQRITALGMAPLRDEVLVRLHLEGGLEISAMLHAGRPFFDVPAPPSPNTAPPAPGPGTAILSYAFTGAAHLLTGPDHLLFLLALLLLVRRTTTEKRRELPGGRASRPEIPARNTPLAKPLFLAITSFTVAHSLSLGLQVLGAVHLPPAPVEAAIALSVLLLARELLRPPGDSTLAQRRPHLVTFVFGLLHGLGFAGGLTALHIPRPQIPSALFGFNVGLEVAQLALVLSLLAVFQVARTAALRLRAPGTSQGPPAHPLLPLWIRRIPAYGIGAIAAFWLFSRASAL